jgi:hypothetical protein
MARCQPLGTRRGNGSSMTGVTEVFLENLLANNGTVTEVKTTPTVALHSATHRVFTAGQSVPVPPTPRNPQPLPYLEPNPFGELLQIGK